jgi:predicted transcriptional regulator
LGWRARATVRLAMKTLSKKEFNTETSKTKKTSLKMLRGMTTTRVETTLGLLKQSITNSRTRRVRTRRRKQMPLSRTQIHPSALRTLKRCMN